MGRTVWKTNNRKEGLNQRSEGQVLDRTLVGRIALPHRKKKMGFVPNSRANAACAEYFRTLDRYSLKEQTWVMLSNPIVVLILVAIMRAAYDARKRSWGREK